MSDFLQYQLTQEKERTARSRFEDATSRLVAAQTENRFAELVSQSFESLKLAKDLGTISDRERAIGLAFARYAVHGRSENKDFQKQHGSPATMPKWPTGMGETIANDWTFLIPSEDNVTFRFLEVGDIVGLRKLAAAAVYEHPLPDVACRVTGVYLNNSGTSAIPKKRVNVRVM